MVHTIYELRLPGCTEVHITLEIYTDGMMQTECMKTNQREVVGTTGKETPLARRHGDFSTYNRIMLRNPSNSLLMIQIEFPIDINSIVQLNEAGVLSEFAL